MRYAMLKPSSRGPKGRSACERHPSELTWSSCTENCIKEQSKEVPHGLVIQCTSHLSVPRPDTGPLQREQRGLEMRSMWPPYSVCIPEWAHRIRSAESNPVSRVSSQLLP